jgi:hypothetical protein
MGQIIYGNLMMIEGAADYFFLFSSLARANECTDFQYVLK